MRALQEQKQEEMLKQKQELVKQINSQPKQRCNTFAGDTSFSKQFDISQNFLAKQSYLFINKQQKKLHMEQNKSQVNRIKYAQSSPYSQAHISSGGGIGASFNNQDSLTANNNINDSITVDLEPKKKMSIKQQKLAALIKTPDTAFNKSLSNYNKSINIHNISLNVQSSVNTGSASGNKQMLSKSYFNYEEQGDQRQNTPLQVKPATSQARTQTQQPESTDQQQKPPLHDQTPSQKPVNLSEQARKMGKR